MRNEMVCMDVSKVFQGDIIKFHALEGINVRFAKGEFVAIVGPSDSGKSTLLSLRERFDISTSKEITYGNQLINNSELAIRADRILKRRDGKIISDTMCEPYV